MTIDQQPGDTLRDRFERATDGVLPTPDLAGAIAGGRHRRRVRLVSYVAGSSAAAVVAAALVVPHLAAGADRAGDRVPAASDVVSDETFVPGTDVDERLAAAVAATLPMLPAPTDVFPMDWRSPGNEAGYAAPAAGLRLPDEQFADATAWQLRYDVEADHTVLITVAKPVDGQWPSYACDAEGLLSLGPHHVNATSNSGVPSCLYMDGADNPQTPAYLTMGLGDGDQGHVTTAFTERVQNGTEAEGQERALFKGDDGLALISALELEAVLQPQE